jgi:starch-binding outer membrane protein, SusD/RagB family
MIFIPHRSLAQSRLALTLGFNAVLAKIFLRYIRRSYFLHRFPSTKKFYLFMNISFSHISRWTLALALVLALASCNNELNIEPVNEIDARSALETSQAVKATLTGAYDRLGLGTVMGGQIQLYADIYGDDEELSFEGTFTQLNQIWTKRLPNTNLSATQTWRDCYTTINLANTVLVPTNLAKVVPEDKNAVEGEALFIRGLVYFELARLYGKVWNDGSNTTNLAVPLILTPTGFTTGESDFRARNTVAEVYTQVIADLTRAEQLLLNSGDETRATKAAAQAILSRVYLMQQNYSAARDAANRVITSNLYLLALDFSEVFSERAAGYAEENIFRIAVDAQDGNSVNSLNEFYAASEYGGRGGDFAVQDKHLGLYNSADVRGQFFEDVGLILTSKFNDQFGDVVIVRLAEMYLTRAECNVRLGSSVGASPAEDISLIRERTGLAAVTAPTLENILLERRLELAFEGHRLHDLKRTRGSIRFINETIPVTADRLVFPIPKREIDANRRLVQNPGY